MIVASIAGSGHLKLWPGPASFDRLVVPGFDDTLSGEREHSRSSQPRGPGSAAEDS